MLAKHFNIDMYLAYQTRVDLVQKTLSWVLEVEKKFEDIAYPGITFFVTERKSLQILHRKTMFSSPDHEMKRIT